MKLSCMLRGQRGAENRELEAHGSLALASWQVLLRSQPPLYDLTERTTQGHPQGCSLQPHNLDNRGNVLHGDVGELTGAHPHKGVVSSCFND